MAFFQWPYEWPYIYEPLWSTVSLDPKTHEKNMKVSFNEGFGFPWWDFQISPPPCRRRNVQQINSVLGIATLDVLPFKAWGCWVLKRWNIYMRWPNCWTMKNQRCDIFFEVVEVENMLLLLLLVVVVLDWWVMIQWLMLLQVTITRKKRSKHLPRHDSSWWWFQRFLIFTPIWGNDPFWRIFFRWVVQPPTRDFHATVFHKKVAKQKNRSIPSKFSLLKVAKVRRFCWGGKASVCDQLL